MKSITKKAVFFAILSSLLLAITGAFADEPAAEAWTHTGWAIRQKSILFIKVDVYRIDHFSKGKFAKNKAAAIDFAGDKKFSINLKRSFAADKLRDALKEGYEKNGYSDATKIGKFASAFDAGELKEGTSATIQYDSARKVTTLRGNGKVVEVEGEDFMKATWRIWFGKIDQDGLGDALIKKL